MCVLAKIGLQYGGRVRQVCKVISLQDGHAITNILCDSEALEEGEETAVDYDASEPLGASAGIKVQIYRRTELAEASKPNRFGRARNTVSRVSFPSIE